jgi:transposase
LRIILREDRQMQAIYQIPGDGELTASALVAAVRDFGTFKSGRQLAQWVGLTPRQVGTGGKTQQFNRFEGEHAKCAMMERRSNRVGGNPINRQHLECIPELGASAANSHYEQ